MTFFSAEPLFASPSDDLIWVAAPFLLALPLGWLGIRSIFSRRLRTAEIVAVWSCGGLSACGTVHVLWAIGADFVNGYSAGAVATVVATGGTLLAGGTAAFARRGSVSACLIALYAPFLANALFCLVDFGPPNVGPGWYVTLFIAIVMFLETLRILLAGPFRVCRE